MSIAYLRLWKMCEVQLSRLSASDPPSLFDVIPLDEGKIIKDFRKLASSDLDWADNPTELRSDIKRVLELYESRNKGQQELTEIEGLRSKFQSYALHYSADVAIADSATT